MARRGWTHYTKVKNSPDPCQGEQWMATPHVDPMKLIIKRLLEPA
jgi:hypothetical protein